MQLFYEILEVYPHRIDMAEIIRTNTLLEDYLNNHEIELKILDENGNRLTTRQFVQNYINEKPSSRFDEKRSPNIASFGKTS
jgi:hypothetical protein